MTGSQQRLDIGPAPEIVATRADRDARADRDDAASSAPAVVASNVVLFTPARRETGPADNAPALPFDPAQRPAPFLPGRDRRVLLSALFALSLFVHGGLYFIFNREPEPMVSTGVEAISVDLIVGSNTPAGPAAAGESREQAAPPETPQQKPDAEPAKAEPDP